LKNEPYTVGFDFRVQRVSVVDTSYHCPRLEIQIDIDDTGVITVHDWFGEPSTPQQHQNFGFEQRMPFTVERWRKCQAIRDGIEDLKKCLDELFKDGAAERLDALKGTPLLATGTETKL